MRIWFLIIQLIKFILRTFVTFLQNGNECIVCGKKCFTTVICKKCQEQYFGFSLENSRCKFCGKVMLFKGDICTSCKTKAVNIHIDKVLPLFSYRLWNKEILFTWKIKGERSLSFLFAKIFSKALKKIECCVVVPVPPRPNKINENGWDQIDEVSKFLEFVFDVRVLRLLERKSQSEQKKLDREQRLQNIEQSYVLRSESEIKKILNGEELPKTVCLIDDVTTTGATLERCAKLLKEVGVERVIALTLFIVD